jgi:hypothetical protein
MTVTATIAATSAPSSAATSGDIETVNDVGRPTATAILTAAFATMTPIA